MTTRDELREVMAELELRKQSLNNIYKFAEWMLPSGHPDFIFKPAKHHRVMLDKFQQIGDGELKRLMIFLPPGAAKALALDTPIPTPDGWTTMGKLIPHSEYIPGHHAGWPCAYSLHHGRFA